MTVTQGMLDVCQEAFYLLRQDVQLPALASAASDTSMEWTKAKAAFGYAHAEVLAAHDWRFARSASEPPAADTWPTHLKKVLVYCLARELAVQVAGRTEDLKNCQALYNRFLTDARLKDLEEDTSEDPVAKEVVSTIRGYFAADAADLPRSMLSVYGRIEAVRQSAFREILAAHDWQGLTSITAGEVLPPIAKAAWVALIEQKLCVAAGLSPEAAANFETVWRTKLREARIADLESTPLPDGIAGEVLALVRGTFGGEEALPRSLAALTARIAKMTDVARREVLDAHPWGFALEDEPTASTESPGPGVGEYVHVVPTPAMVRLVSVIGPEGDLCDWRLAGGTIRSRTPVARLVYIGDREDLAEWPPSAYRLVVLRLAADLAKTVAAKPESREYQERLYRDALAEAKLRDTSESNPGARTYRGRNHYAEVMAGNREAWD